LTQKNSERFGARVKRLRKVRGFSSSQALAEAIGNPLISESVIRNIENGRKAEISIVHLLEISFVLEVPPLMLLFDYNRPRHHASLPGLGPNFEDATVEDLDNWFSMLWSMEGMQLGERTSWPAELEPELKKVNVTRRYRVVNRQVEWWKQAATNSVQLKRKYLSKANEQEMKERMSHARLMWGEWLEKREAITSAGKDLGMDFSETPGSSRWDAALDQPQPAD
jgi:transcriptional regulator with XRE-family HTH domain